MHSFCSFTVAVACMHPMHGSSSWSTKHSHQHTLPLTQSSTTSGGSPASVVKNKPGFVYKPCLLTSAFDFELTHLPGQQLTSGLFCQLCHVPKLQLTSTFFCQYHHIPRLQLTSAFFCQFGHFPGLQLASTFFCQLCHIARLQLTSAFFW